MSFVFVLDLQFLYLCLYLQFLYLCLYVQSFMFVFVFAIFVLLYLCLYLQLFVLVFSTKVGLARYPEDTGSAAKILLHRLPLVIKNI